ncbi:MAG: acyl-CoA dehydrogenase [Alphaproteobacteria bacterium]|nr:acyl-CoA dehydrogenase [Alphaproteobacteria bacterium]MDD9920200.1 acyl-CoA dehydrogenase [Alphaproteobacteria bacterium]
MTLQLILLAILSFITLLYLRKGFLALCALILFGILAWRTTGVPIETFRSVTYVLISVLVIFGVPPIRQFFVSRIALKLAAKALPTIGETERIALEAGSVWWEGDLFRGNPDWNKMLNFKVKKLTKEEQAFLDGPVEELCSMIDDFKIAQDRDLPPKVWKFMKDQKFFGMIIPKKDGGLGFSAAAHSAVVTKISSVSLTAAVTVMVPNSLGPGELLLRYGTKEQKKHYLPRLADGRELPCFALTEPHAGSDAASGQSFGVICKQKVDGKDVIGMKLTFNKRYITLAPVATVVGLAFRLYDPDQLLGKKEDLGITCALLPRDTKGLEIGNRHDPMGVPFQNGPVRGKDVFVPLDVIIGGEKQIGNGWKMLMECLSAGRGISLPSLSVGAAEFSIRAASGYALVREQFGLNIGRFEGVRERLVRTAGNTYWMNATRRFTCGAVDAGEHPSVASAIAKAYLTEGMRLAINDGMDVLAGSAICRGPSNIFSRPYMGIPIGITVEGANILTRSLIVFGQGAMRCHPYLQDEVNAIQKNDIKAFDKAFFGHINHVFSNGVRAFILGLTNGYMAKTPVSGHYARYYRQLSRYSAALAFMADIGLATLGGALKRKEYLSGQYADAFAWLYLASATLKQAHDDGYPAKHQPLVDWCLQEALYHIEDALNDVLRNLPNKLLALKARFMVFPFGRWQQKPSEKQVEAVAKVLLNPASGVRDDLTQNIFVPTKAEPGLGLLEDAYAKSIAAQPGRDKLTQALRSKKISKGTVLSMADKALKAKVITKAEHTTIAAAEKAKDAAVQVDDFTVKTHKTLK